MSGDKEHADVEDAGVSGRVADPPPTSVSAVVSLKPPIQVEAQFACRCITSERTKFDHLVSSLSPEYAAEVRDLLLRPPTDNPYTTLKEQLTKRTALSEQRRLQQLLTGEELGDRKPTQLLHRMQQLLGDRPGIDPSFLRELFLQRLPHSARIVLASTPEGTALAVLAEMADKIMEVAATPPSVAAIKTPKGSGATPTPQTASAAEIEDLRSEITRLEKLVLKLSRSRSPARKSRSSHRSPTPTPPPTRPTTPSAGTTRSMATRHNTVTHRVPGRQTSRPAASGNKCRRPNPPWSPFSRT